MRVFIKFFILIALFGIYKAEAASIPYTATASSGMTYYSGATILDRINDGDISTIGVNDYQVHPTNAIGRTITMTFTSDVTIASADFYNRTASNSDRIGGAEMIFKDNLGSTLYTYTFPAVGVADVVNISDPGGDIVNVRTVELTSFNDNSQNFREIVFNSTTPAALGEISNPANSCLDIKNSKKSASSGNYYLQFGSMTFAEQFYCEMIIDGGGWTLLFQRSGGNDNRESCGSNINDFLQNDCGSVNDLDYGDSYSAAISDVVGEIDSNSYLSVQYDAAMDPDLDDAFIVYTTNNLFPDNPNTGTNIPYDTICDIDNNNCDSSDGVWRYASNSWFHYGYCAYGYAGPQSFGGMYGYCPDGVTGGGFNGRFGNRGGGSYPQSYSEAKLWGTGFGSTYMERVFVRGSNIAPQITITAPTKLSNVDITNTTIQIIDDTQVDAGDISIHASSTAGTNNLSCGQTSVTEVNCTVEITSSGTLVVEAMDNRALITRASETNYIIDTIDPQIPTVSIDVITNGINNPIITFSSLDNVAIDYYEVEYIADNGAAGVSTMTTTDSPATSPVTLVLDPDELTHTVTVRAFDTAGNSSESIIKFPPIVSFNTPTLFSNVDIADATVTVTSPQGNDLENIILTANTTGASLGACTGNGGDITSPYASPVTCIINAITDTGTLSVSADDAVNGAEGLNNQSFVIDTVLPSLTITAPTKESNQAITDTTVKVTDDESIDAADVVISAVNTATFFSISNQNCVQTTGKEVNCTLQVDANHGRGDIQVQVQDRAGNQLTIIETGYEIDTALPAISIFQDLTGVLGQSDTFRVIVADDHNLPSSHMYGFSADDTCDNTDAYAFPFTNNAVNTISSEAGTGSYVCLQAFDTFGNVNFRVLGQTLNVDTTNPSISFTDNVEIGPLQSDTISVNITDVNLSTTYQYGFSVDNICDATDSYTETINTGSSFVINTEAQNGNYICIRAEDEAGNVNYAASSNPLNIDITLPTAPTVNQPTEKEMISGTGEINASIVVTTDSGATCSTTVLGDGTWSCIFTPEAIPGEEYAVESTDAALNVISVSGNIYKEKSKTASRKRSQKELQEIFGNKDESKQEEETKKPSVEENPLNGEQCASHLLITNNMKKGDRDNKYSSYNKGLVTQVSLLQTHMNRILQDQYGNLASGPVDGIYGNLTKQGVERLQTKLNTILSGTMTPLDIDGIVGPYTKKAINTSC